MRKVSRTFINVLGKDVVKRSELIALWKALEYHDYDNKNQFTTSLHKFVFWECLRAKREKESGIKTSSLCDNNVDIAISGNEFSIDIADSLNKLPENQRSILYERFYNGRTMEEIGELNNYSKESASKNVRKALDRFKQIMSEGVK